MYFLLHKSDAKLFGEHTGVPTDQELLDTNPEL